MQVRGTEEGKVMEKVVLKAEPREITGKKVKLMRKEGKLPGVMYGAHFEAKPIVLDRREASNILNRLSSSSIVTLEVEGEEHAALVREKQRDYLKDEYLHVDFQVVSLTEKIRTEVAISFVGSAPAVKELNALVVAGINSIEVECLPQDLPEKIEVDISNLLAIGDAIYLKELSPLPNVNYLTNPEELIAVISAVKEEVEEEVVAEEVAEEEAVEPEVIEKGKKEEEEIEGEEKPKQE